MAVARDVLSLEVSCDPHAPRVVRDALAAAYDGGWSLDDGLLVASELVTNAVRRSGCMVDHRLRVDVGRRENCLLISVHDPGVSGKDAEPVHTKRSEPGGWGLALIERLSLRWGSERSNGYRVWAELPAYG
ncbi:MAG TPA: ATP-binding protein [Solirubrobacteraceae bacterium]|jgi:anti-sigma regulatory factor (Ser/Thr protein kinase)